MLVCTTHLPPFLQLLIILLPLGGRACLQTRRAGVLLVCDGVTPPTHTLPLPPPFLQLLIINVEDQDFRDMLFDYRITRQGVRCVCVCVTCWLA